MFASGYKATVIAASASSSPRSLLDFLVTPIGPLRKRINDCNANTAADRRANRNRDKAEHPPDLSDGWTKYSTDEKGRIESSDPANDGQNRREKWSHHGPTPACCAWDYCLGRRRPPSGKIFDCVVIV